MKSYQRFRIKQPSFVNKVAQIARVGDKVFNGDGVLKIIYVLLFPFAGLIKNGPYT